MVLISKIIILIFFQLFLWNDQSSKSVLSQLFAIFSQRISLVWSCFYFHNCFSTFQIKHNLSCLLISKNYAHSLCLWTKRKVFENVITVTKTIAISNFDEFFFSFLQLHTKFFSVFNQRYFIRWRSLKFFLLKSILIFYIALINILWTFTCNLIIIKSFVSFIIWVKIRPNWCHIMAKNKS
jgi:hypothetical protein